KRGAKQFGEKLPIPFQYLITGNMSVSRAALDAAGLFDESFQGYGGEDSLFAYKIWKTYPQGIRFSQKAGALDLHQYDLNLMLEKYHHYGRYNLPRLIRDFPETEKALHADWVTGSGPKRWIGRLFFNRPFYSVARWKMIFMPYPLSNWLIRYLIACAVITGLRSGLSNPSDM
nr:hypothetical protein [FCB group bacterium]